MPSFKVLEVREQEPWSNDHGQFIGYTMLVVNSEGGQFVAKINQKPETDAPQPGQVIEANLQPGKGDFPPLLKRIYSDNSSGSSARSYPPEVEAAIRRQHSQEMALRWMQIHATAGLVTERPVLGNLRMLIDWFDTDLNPAERGKTVHGLPVRNEPQRTGAPEPTTPIADYPEQHSDAGDVPWENPNAA